MTFPAYPAYKDSGVEWLGEVPEHWAVNRLKRAIERIESGTSVNAADLPAEPGSVGVLKTSCVYTGKFNWAENKTVDDEDLGRVSCPLRKDTLIVSRMNTPDLVGATGLVTEAPNGIFLPDRLWQVYVLANHSPGFIFYFTKSREYREQVKMACSGTSASMQNLGQDDFRGLIFAGPPKIEQIQIARFLDHEVAHIDALIEEQQRLIELLKEKRQAVISHAVTKGLDPRVPMKDSGVEWLGEVPAHWKQIRIKHILNAMIDAEHKTAEYSDDGEYLVCRTTNVRNGLLSLDGAKYADRNTYIDWTRRGVPEPLDILFTREAPAGEACLVPEDLEICLGQRMVLFKLDKTRIDPAFTVHSIYAGLASDFVKQLSQGSTVSHFNMADIGNIPLFEPPLSEQKGISDFLAKRCDSYDLLINEAQSSVKLISERRSALISAAVTGKIDVRGWQPPTRASFPELEEEAV
ncbi:restriction endonuclease subunit S [Stenotrophomonas sp. MH181796]|nr:restriction endonuclease subunit S [Stenotrophomonas sp. MH181796]